MTPLPAEQYPALRELADGYWRVEAPSGQYEAPTATRALAAHLGYDEDHPDDCPCGGEGFYFVSAVYRRDGSLRLSWVAGTEPLRVPCETCEAYEQVMSWHPDDHPHYVAVAA